MKHSKLTFALALSLSSSMLSSGTFARESISTVSARVSAIETQLTAGVPQLTTELGECGGKFDVVDRIPITNPATGAVVYEADLPNASFLGILADADTKSRWDYGYIDTQLYTNEQGQLACGVVVDLQALIESVIDIGFGSACASTGVLSMSRDAKLEAVHSVCEIADNAARVVNSYFWLGVTGAERIEEVIEGGNPTSTKGHIADLYRSEIDLLTLSIPEGPAALITQIKEQAVDNPLEALSRGSLLVGTVEIPLADLLPPFEIVLAELETNGQSLLETPSQFVATTAAIVAEHYLDEILTEELLLELIEAASKLEFVDEDGNQVFEMALTNDGTGAGLNAMGFKLDDSNAMTFASGHVGIEVDSTLLEVSSGSLSLNIEGTSVITASSTEVCLLGVCIDDDLLSLSGIPVDLEDQLSTLTSGVATLNGIVPINLPTQLSVLTSGLAGLQTIVPAMQGQLGTLNTNYGTLSNTVTASAGHINTMWASLYYAGGPGRKAEDLWNQVHSAGGYASQLSTLNTFKSAYDSSNIIGKANAIWLLVHHDTGRFDIYDTNGDGVKDTDGGMFARMNATTDLLNATASTVGVIIARLNAIPSIPSIPGIPVISDARLKTDISPLTSSLDTILQLQGVSHLWNEDAVALGVTEPDRRAFGFIAQEVQAAVPELVVEGDDGYLRVHYGKMAPLLVEGIKDQQTQIADLHADIDSLRAQNEQLTAYICSTDSTAPFCGG